MLAPQFSLRRLLAWVTVAAVCCVPVPYARQGQPWAIAMLFAMGGVVITVLIQGILVGLVWMLGTLVDRSKKRRGEVSKS